MQRLKWSVVTLALASLVVLPAALAQAGTAKAEVSLVTAEGIGTSVGTVVITDVEGGITLDVQLKGLPAGTHGFHIHEKGDCGPATDATGKMGAALAAGGHFDPLKTGRHLGPGNGGHEGDLPVLTVKEDGTVNEIMTVKGLSTSAIKHLALMIHEGGDNYSDTPKPLGGGGTRIACGVIK